MYLSIVCMSDDSKAGCVFSPQTTVGKSILRRSIDLGRYFSNIACKVACCELEKITFIVPLFVMIFTLAQAYLQGSSTRIPFGFRYEYKNRNYYLVNLDAS